MKKLDGITTEKAAETQELTSEELDKVNAAGGSSAPKKTKDPVMPMLIAVRFED